MRNIQRRREKSCTGGLHSLNTCYNFTGVMKQHAAGSGLKAAREKAGLTQTELARRIGRTPAYINLMEKGRTKQARYDDVIAIAAELGCAPDEIVPRKRARRKAARREVAA